MMADDAVDQVGEDDDYEYEYVEIAEGEELPEGFEYEYVEDVPETAVLGELPKQDGQQDVDALLNDILEDRPDVEEYGFDTSLNAVEKTEIEREQELKPEPDTETETVFEPVAMVKENEFDVMEGLETPLSSNETPVDVEVDGDHGVLLDELEAVEMPEHIEPVIEEFDAEPEIEAETESEIEAEEEIEESEVLIEDVKTESAFEEVSDAENASFDVIGIESGYLEAARSFDETKEFDSFEPEDGARALRVSDETAKLVIFSRRIVSLDSKTKELELPLEENTARYVRIVKKGADKLDLFNESKFKFMVPTEDFVKIKGHFIYGNLGDDTGLIVDDMMNVSLKDYKGKMLSFSVPVKGMIVSGKGILYFSNVSNVIVD